MKNLLKLPIETATRSWTWSLWRCLVQFYNIRSLRATMNIIRWSLNRTSKDHNQLNVIYQSLLAAWYILQSTRKHCTRALESAGALELGNYNHTRESYGLDMNKGDTTTCTWRTGTMITECYPLVRRRKFTSMPSHKQKLCTPGNSECDKYRDTSYGIRQHWCRGL